MKKCELLIPVGEKKQIIAAVENGADAVYIRGCLIECPHLSNILENWVNLSRDSVRFWRWCWYN